ncbi:cutinase family protein [Streptomyces sp. LN590]|uniref:cutinase family protein n=1 Tax=Streptomyces sp. LN590 TaxID=3112980 RepID=UPI00371ADB79
MIRNRVAQCPHQKIILSGYSQGAWVIRMALQALKQQPDVNWSEIEGAIAGIGLIADPYNKIFMPPVPEELESRTFKVCLPGDVVCNNPVDNYPSPKCDPFTILCPHVRYGTEQGAGGRTKIQEVADFLRTRLQ